MPWQKRGKLEYEFIEETRSLSSSAVVVQTINLFSAPLVLFFSVFLFFSFLETKKVLVEGEVDVIGVIVRLY